MAHFIRRRPLLVLAFPVALVLLLVAVACGGDDATPTTAPTATTAGVAPTATTAPAPPDSNGRVGRNWSLIHQHSHARPRS